MFGNIVNFVKANKSVIIEKGTIVLAAVAGIVLVGAVGSKIAENSEAPIEVVDEVVNGVAGE
jgi:hypothetical protein